MTRLITYPGTPGNRRVLGPDDGVTAHYEFDAGVPLEVSEESAELLLDPDGPFAAEGFIEGEPPEAANPAGAAGRGDPDKEG